MRYYHLALETGETTDDAGGPVAWAACPALPGAYEEAPTLPAALDRLRDLTRRIIAEHLLRDDPLDPEIVVTERGGAAGERNGADGPLVVPVGDADVEEARAAPLLVIEQPEP
ncbi:MAG: hypothetical protein M3Q65_15440 [Chloroflexota bacterium]|nr:hypothetical protein [Chloroflexota bacterium]